MLLPQHIILQNFLYQFSQRSVQRVKQLLTLTVKSSCLVFNNVYYKHIDGVAMGSPLGPTFTNLFLVCCENRCLDKCPLQFKPKYYCRYVDDIFLMFERKDHVN